MYVQSECGEDWPKYSEFSLCPNANLDFRGRSVRVRALPPNPEFPCPNFSPDPPGEPPPSFSGVLFEVPIEGGALCGESAEYFLNLQLVSLNAALVIFSG